MKIKQEHYEFMKETIKSKRHLIPILIQRIIASSNVIDPDKRLRWDVSFHLIGSTWICDNLYSYLNDNHIDTALKNIMKELEQEEQDTNILENYKRRPS